MRRNMDHPERISRIGHYLLIFYARGRMDSVGSDNGRANYCVRGSSVHSRELA
jgi:hypothetical protein